MAIPDEQVAEVRSATDIVALIGEHAALRRQGTRWVGLCPFHSEKTPSFSVNSEAGLYYCFGCQARGDAISFVRATERLDFADAVRSLADRAGIVLREDRAAGAERRRRNHLLEVMERAVAWYHDRLLSAADAGRARDYLRSRGYDGDVVRRFRIGWAPEGWDELSRSSGLPGRALEEVGLAFVNRRGRLQDAFRGRVLFPICEPSGRPVAIGGRVLPPGREGEPKYKNSTETPIYSKRRTLYALNWAKQDVIASGEVVVCEGYTDVIGCFEAGVPRAVATCGTSLAEEHFQVLRNFARRIVLAYDADAAGQTATGRVYEWERRHEVDVAVAALPAGTDPGELARRDPTALRSALTDARPFLQFRVEQCLAESLATPEARARAAEHAVEVIAEHPDALVRDQYLMTVADRCQVEPGRLRELLADSLRRPPGARAERRTPAPGRSGDRRERDAPSGSVPESPDAPQTRRRVEVGSRPGLEALRFLVHRRPAVEGRLDELLFEDDLERRAYRALAAPTGLSDLLSELDGTDAELSYLLHRLAVEEPLITEETLGDPADGVVVQLVRLAARRELVALRARARQESGGLAETAAAVTFLHRELEELDEPIRANEAAGRLLAWLIDREREAERARS